MNADRLLLVYYCTRPTPKTRYTRIAGIRPRRSLSGARAVQVLGRLNRPAPHLGKAPALLGVVDFVNSVGGLREAFEEFYDVTTMCTGAAGVCGGGCGGATCLAMGCVVTVCCTSTVTAFEG